LTYSGGAESPLSDLYLLVIIVSALTMGKLATLIEMGLIIICFVWLGFPSQGIEVLSLPFLTKLLAQISPMMLVAYITTMLSSDIRTAYGRSFGQMKLLSETDDLTGVTNLRGFSAASEQIFQQAERYARPFSVLMIDSDSLKLVNDTLGHEAGDRLLKLTVQSIKNELRTNPMRQPDIVARYGGDEFVVLLPETTCNSAVIVAERIRKGMESTPISARGQTVTATVSIGVACYPDHGPDFESVLGKADRAMYASKSGGKNRTTASST